MELTSFRIGGVPEHFNMPWHLALEEKRFEQAGIQLKWEDYGGGTGAMAKDLRENTLDMALLLTEGAVADIVKGGNYRIAGLYVSSPLTWGIHVHAESPFREAAELKDKTFAISRYGSGSHLMAVVNAQQRDWDPQKLNFELVGNLEGAREALANGDGDAFMWEKFTTKPLVDSGEWRRVGECPTPWPCFVLVVREDVARENTEAVQKVLDTIRTACQSLKNRPDAVSIIASHYLLKPEDVAVWLQEVEWAKDNTIDSNMLKKVTDTLYRLKLIEYTPEPQELCNRFCKLI